MNGLTLKQRKAQWRALLRTRHNGNRTGRQRDNRATKREKRAGRGNP